MAYADFGLTRSSGMEAGRRLPANHILFQRFSRLPYCIFSLILNRSQMHKETFKSPPRCLCCVWEPAMYHLPNIRLAGSDNQTQNQSLSTIHFMGAEDQIQAIHLIHIILLIFIHTYIYIWICLSCNPI